MYKYTYIFILTLETLLSYNRFSLSQPPKDHKFEIAVIWGKRWNGSNMQEVNQLHCKFNLTLDVWVNSVLDNDSHLYIYITVIRFGIKCILSVNCTFYMYVYMYVHMNINTFYSGQSQVMKLKRIGNLCCSYIPCSL